MIWLLACITPDGKDDTAEEASTVNVVTYTDASDSDGYLSIPVEVPADVGVFQVVVHRDKGSSALEYLYAPDGSKVLDWEDWYDSSYSLTEAFYPVEFASTTNWPVRASDGPLQAGTWEVVVGTYNRNNYAGGQEVTVEVLTRPDPAFDAGELHAVVAYASGVREEEGVAEAVEQAVDYWTELYAAIGIQLTAEFSDIDVDPALPDTYEGLDAFRTFHEDFGRRTVLMVIGEEIAEDRWIYGEAGAIPGPYAAANHAAVEVAWLANAGADADFDEADVLLMGETMAHEVGHYLGLFHPVEDGFEYWDALEDTDECVGYGACESVLAANLMFPYPVCTGMNAASCTRQDELTDDQAGVLHRYVGVE